MENARTKWARRIAEWRASGKTKRDYCEAHGYKYNTFLLRLRQVEVASKTAVASGSPHPLSPPKPATSAPRMALVAPRDSERAGLVVDVGDARITLRRGFDTELLCEVVRALRGSR